MSGDSDEAMYSRAVKDAHSRRAADALEDAFDAFEDAFDPWDCLHPLSDP